MHPKRLFAVDPSLTASGWALFSIDECRPCAVGLISPPGPKMNLSERLTCLQNKINEVFSYLKVLPGEIMICEGPAPLVLNPQSALKVEQVRGVFETVARGLGLTVPGRINPRTVQTELLGMRGKQLRRDAVKEWARETAIRLYGGMLDSIPCDAPGGSSQKSLPQDIIDALLIGTVAVTKVRLSQKTGVELCSVFESRRPKSSSRSASRRGVQWSEQDIRQLATRKQ